MAVTMYPYSRLAPPLSPHIFYALLALSRTATLHPYAIRSAVLNDSLGSVDIASGRLYPLITKLTEEGFIDIIGPKPTSKSGKPRMHYAISTHGTLRLKEELTRLNHAIKTAKSAGLLENTLDLDLQRMLLEVQSG